MRSYNFKKQINNKGCYAEILFDVIYEPERTDSLTVDFQAAAKWEDACKAGIQIFYDYHRSIKTGAVHVKIYEINWLPVDTNNLIVLFASITALLDASNIVVDDLRFDPANENFILPELRKKN